MNICILGDGLTSLSLAKNLVNKKINVHIYQNNKINNLLSSRTIGISKNNLEFFEKEIQMLPKKIKWEIKKIEIYSEKLKKNKILNFENDNKNLFYMIKNDVLHKLLYEELSKSKFFNKEIIKEKNFYDKLLKNNTHPNFYLIDLLDDKKNIDVAQIRAMITYTNKSTFNNMPRFILIDNVENLNKNSINALLKIIEEPNEDIFFILIGNNEEYILQTLKSRCLTFKINFTFTQSINVSNQILKENIFDLINKDLINYYNTPGEIVNLINFTKEKSINLKDYTLINFLNLLINDGYYKKNQFIKNLLINLIELFFLKEYKLSSKKKLLLNFYHSFINKIHNTKEFNLDEESLFLEFQSKLLNE